MIKVTPFNFNNKNKILFKAGNTMFSAPKTMKEFQLYLKKDITQFEDINIFPLIQRGIIPNNQKPDDFFKSVSSKIFTDIDDLNLLKNMLSEGCISFSTSYYKGILNSDSLNSALAVNLDKNKNTIQHLALLEQYIKDEKGIGINFSNFDDSLSRIKDINSYFLYRQKEGDIKRPPAGIALLNVNHPQIIDFIRLKNNVDFNDWCFDLSVVLSDDFLRKVDNDEFLTMSDGTKKKAGEIYSALLDSMLKKGEPGIIFSDDANYICDCCATAPLKPDEGLTLAHINLSKFYDTEKKKIDFNKLNKAANILSKAMFNTDKNGYIGILGYQSLLDKMNIQYGSDNALKVLDDMLFTIKSQILKFNLKMAISPTGTISRILKVSPAIEPKNKGDYLSELKTLKVAQKHIDGNISKTIILDKNAAIEDVDFIVRKSKEYKINGITVFKNQ